MENITDVYPLALTDLLAAVFDEAATQEYDELKTWLIPNGQKPSGPNLLAAFTVEWCNRCGPFVRCPRCGNNSCNGGYGEEDETGGGKCPVCPITYELTTLLLAAVPDGIKLQPTPPSDSSEG